MFSGVFVCVGLSVGVYDNSKNNEWIFSEFLM